MSNVSLNLDTEALAQHYETISVERQFKAGKNLIAMLAPAAGEQVLDVGAGTGLLAEHVAGLVGPSGAVLGIDPLPLRIALAKRKERGNLSFAVADAHDLSALPANAFDIVYLNAVFHWLTDQKLALRQIFRVLKPGGRLGISTGSKDHPGVLQEIKAKLFSKPPFDRYPQALNGVPGRVNAGQLAILFAEAGFETKQIDVQPNVQIQPSAEAAIEFSQASSFGNFLGNLPAELRPVARESIRQELERLRTPEGIRSATARIVAVAVKPL